MECLKATEHSDRMRFRLRTLLIVLALATPGAVIMTVWIARLCWVIFNWPDPN